MSENKSYTQLRNELLDLIKQVNETRSQMLPIVRELSQTVSLLIASTDKLVLKSLNEHPSGVKISQIDPEADSPSLAGLSGFRKKGQRACSICGQPGHRKTTCPQANKKYREDRKPVPEVPRGRAPKVKGKRACSKCGQPGHRAPNCPN